MQYPGKGLLRLTVLMLFSLVAPLAFGQFRASITGTVTDSTGAVVPGATITLIEQETNRTLTTKSDANGFYSFNALPPNHFKLTAAMQGFQTKTLENLTIIPEQANTVDLQVAVGTADTEITVSADSRPALDTATATISGTVSENQIQHMPALGRDVMQFAQLAPGAFGDGARAGGGGTNSLPGSNMAGTGATDGIFKTENAPQIVANGGQNETNGIMIDGISTASAVWGGSTIITPSADSVDNVKVNSNAYDAEFGRFSGAQIQITTKSGSNDWHGSLFFKANRPGLNAYQRWNGPTSDIAGTATERGLLRDTSRYNQFGGSVGGPIWKDKVFFFFNYETLRNNSTSYTTGWYETPQFLANTRSGSIANRYATYAGAGVAAVSQLRSTCALLGLSEGPQCQTVSGGVDLGSPLTSPLGSRDPGWQGVGVTGTGNGLDGVPDLAQWYLRNPTQITQQQYNGRLDVTPDAKDRISFTIYWQPQDTRSYQGAIRPYNSYYHVQANDAFTVLWNHTFSPSLLNEARANAAGWRWNEIDSNPTVPFGLTQETVGTAGSGLFPSVSANAPLSNLGTIGTPGPSTLNQWTFGYQDILTKIAGRHTLKMGGSLTRLYYLNQSPYNARPSFIFANFWDWANDAPYSESGTFDPRTGTPNPNRQDNRQELWAGFVQDDWKVTPSLTVNLGLRYAYNDAFRSKQNNMNVVQLGEGSALISGLTILQNQSKLYDPQKFNFGPQIGFAYNPDYFQKKVVFRGGFGLNYNQNEIAITANGSNNSPAVLQQTLLGSAGQVHYELPSDLNTVYGFSSNPAAVSAIGSNGLPSASGVNVSVTGFDPHVKTMMTYHYSLDTQIDFGHNLVGTIGYQGTVAHHNIIQQNMMAIAAVNGYALNEHLSGVGYYTNAGDSNYSAMIATLKHTFSKGFQLEGQYTWSKSMDNGSQPYFMNPYPYNSRDAWGRSDYNVNDAFKLFGMYQPTFFKGQRLAHTFLDGWTLTGVYTWHSGFPWTPTYNVGNLYYRNSPYTTLYPAAYTGRMNSSVSNDEFKKTTGQFPDGGAAYFTKPTYTAVDASAPITATAGVPQAPGIARNSFSGPNYKNVDASIAKGFALPNAPILGEHANFEIRMDAFNVFNNLNLNSSSIVTNIESSNFGQAGSALGARVIDFQARFAF